MNKKTLCTLLLTASCLPAPEPQQPEIVTVYIPAMEEPSTSDFYPKKPSTKQASHEILNALFNNSVKVFNNSSAFRDGNMKIIAHYGVVDGESQKTLQYFLVDDDKNVMIVIEDSQPYGSVDGWYKCLVRGRRPASEFFKCALISEGNKMLTELFEETVMLIHQHLQKEEATLEPRYAELFQHLIGTEYGKVVILETVGLPL